MPQEVPAVARFPTLLVVTWCALLAVPPVAFAQQDIGTYLASCVQRLGAAVNGRLVVSLGTFTYADKKVGSAFSRLLEEGLSTGLSRQGSFELFARDKLDAILTAQELNLSDLVDQETVVPLGRMKGVQALLSGTFFDTPAEVRVYLELVSLETGTVAARAETAIPRTAIPASVSILPDNYNDAMYVLDQLGQVGAIGSGAFEVRAWSVRGNGGTYRDGEQLVVNFFANRDCFVKVYHVEVEGRTKLIFPNPYYRDNAVRGGRICRIPDASYSFTFDLGAPYGTEFIKVVASTVQFTDIEEAFQDMGRVSKAVVARGLNVTAKDVQIAQATFSYTILE